MTDLLITGGTVITMDGARRVIPDGAVLVAGGRIQAVGPRAELPAEAAQVIDARGKVVMPGLIDAHGHAGHGLIKTMGSGDSQAWFNACGQVYTHASPPSFWRAEARLAALERLMFGITTGVSVLGGGDCIMRVDAPEHGAAHCEGVASIGIRDVMAVGHTRPPFPKAYDGAGVTAAQQYAVMAALFRDWHGRGRQALCTMMPVFRDDHARRAEIAEQGAAMLRLAAEHDAMFHQDGHRGGSIALAREFGLLSPRAFLSHCTDLSDADIAACAESGAHVVHNPSAIAAVRGFCPVVRLLEAGVNVVLGSDATAPDRSSDMFRHMFMARRYAQRAAADDNLLPPGRVLEMCTVDAARALNMPDIGALEVGKRADIITVDMTAPHMAPANMPVWRVVCFASGADVRDVVVDGQILMRERVVPHLDVLAVAAEAERETEAMLAASGLAHMVQEDAGWGRIRRV